MNCHETTEGSPALRDHSADVTDIVRTLTEQFSILLGRPERVAECCAQLERVLSAPPTPADIELLTSLLPILASHGGALVVPLYDLIERSADASSDPWPLLKGMLAARDTPLVQRSLHCTLRCIERGALRVEREVAGHMAELVDLSAQGISDPGSLPLVGAILRRMETPGPARTTDPVTTLYLEAPDGKLRRLAASVLDTAVAPISADIARAALGNEAFEFLAPYLAYTRATHADVLSLLPAPGLPLPALPSLRKALAEIGEDLLRQIIGTAGWPQINLGLEIRHYVRVTPGESLPLMLLPAEARLAKRCGAVRQTSDHILAIVHGGRFTEGAGTTTAADPASRFRNYNLAHADVLADFLAVAPLTVERVRSILGRMDGIVGEFIGLFASMHDECSILPAVYDGIKKQILMDLESCREGEPLPPDVTRLTVMFEDPQAMGQVRTLHGLKRYLHQKGLRLGFRLVQRTLSTNRTVGLFLCSRKRIQQSLDVIHYADFEPEADGSTAASRMPYSVSLVADGFARQLLYGQQSFPRVDIFCYGNEIHYYLSFRNHPAFLRVNFSPPLQGGMIDLEYYGVSKYELAEHPNPSLTGLQRFFRALGFHIAVENTRVHARFDKEHTANLATLCEKAEMLFCLAPYLLDIDWTIGGLRLDVEAREKVAAAWADSFAAWGVLPLRLLLTRDRQGVIASILDTPTGRREVAWSGTGAYTDRFTAGAGEFFRTLYAVAEQLDPELARKHPVTAPARVGQISIERSLLLPLRRALARGELTETAKGYERTSPELFQRLSEPEQCAELIASGEMLLQSASALAYLIGPLERYLSFRTVGTVGYCDVQSARLPLQQEDLGIHVVRGEQNNACLAFYTHDTILYRRRGSPAEPWQSNAAFDTTEFLALLRRVNYPVPGLEQLPPGLPGEVRRMQEGMDRALPAEPRRPIPGERTVGGMRATPGRAVGRTVFGTKGRTPEDFSGAILVTAALQPHDGALLHRAAGVVSTGGGILSHVALLAAQFQKPALVIAGTWESDPQRPPLLRFVSTEYELEEKKSHGFHITARRQIRECEQVLHEGDLVIIDAREDLLRVLGQEPDTLALHEGFRQLGRTIQDLAQTTSDRDILLLRGRRIHARHQIEKILQRLSDPVLACHALDELLQDTQGIGRIIDAAEKAYLARLILRSTRVAGIAARHLRWVVRGLHRNSEKALRDARDRIPSSVFLHEILHLRLDVLRTSQSLADATSCLRECGFEDVPREQSRASGIDRAAGERVGQLRNAIASAVASAGKGTEDPRCRHRLSAWKRLNALMPAAREEQTPLEALSVRLSQADADAVLRLSSHSILWPGEGGFELSPLIGWKAANLAEIERLAGESLVPRWFVVSDHAFRDILYAPPDRVLPHGTGFPDGAPTLWKAIQGVLGQPRLNRYQKASLIRTLWDWIVLPQHLAGELVAAYRHLGEAAPPGQQTPPDHRHPLVALRSSSCEEDAEIAAGAGEFDTFLFIQGEKALLTYLLRTWSGLWNDRALHTREMMGTTMSCAGGGVIVQRIVNSRVSGVLQTVNIARNEFREMVINAGWGLGEGVVSGTVAADQIVVSKEGNLEKGPLRFSYVTADKREYVVFNKQTGLGTMRTEAPYHKRLRPALEYTELCELVAVAARLEAAFGYPLDIEFGFEESRLWILQVRPVPTAHALVRETLEHHPLERPGGVSHAIQGGRHND